MLLDDVATYLDTQSTALAIFSGTTGNLGKSIALDVGTVPDTFVSLYETPGVPNGYTMSTGIRATVAYESPVLQVLSRSASYATARTNAQTVYTILDGLAGQNLPTSTGTTYLDFSAVQAPFLLQRDEHDRYIVSVNFNVRKQVG